MSLLAAESSDLGAWQEALPALGAITSAGLAAATAAYSNRRRERSDAKQVDDLRRSLALETLKATHSAAAAYERLEVAVRPPNVELHGLDVESPRVRITNEKSYGAAKDRSLAERRNQAGTTYKILTDHYSNALTQSRAYFLLSYIVGIIGFLVMVGGVGMAYAGSLDSGVLAAIVGALVDAAAGLIFLQGNKAQKNSQDNLKQLAETVRDDNNRETALHLVSLIDDADRRDDLIADLARLAMESATTRPSTAGQPTSDVSKELPEGRPTNPSSREGRVQSPDAQRKPEETH